MLRPHDREYAKLGVVGLASQEFDNSLAFFFGDSVASDEFGSDRLFVHIGQSSVRKAGEKLTDMLPDSKRRYQAIQQKDIGQTSRREIRTSTVRGHFSVLFANLD